MSCGLNQPSASTIAQCYISRILIAAMVWLVSVAPALRCELAKCCFMRLVTWFCAIQVRTKPAS